MPSPPRGSTRLRGDGLVPVTSALGSHPKPGHNLGFEAADTHLEFDCNHFDLLSNETVGRRLREWFTAA